MIPYSYNMVDMGGIDLATANGTVIEGLYNRIALARNACGDLILFNWKFAEIEIAPSACSTLDEGTSIIINGMIEVTELDEINILGIEPPVVPVEPLIVTENGVYEARPPASGFNPVTVNVSRGFEVPDKFLGKSETGYYVSTNAGDRVTCNGRYFERTSSLPAIIFGAYIDSYRGYALVAKSLDALAGTGDEYGVIVTVEDPIVVDGEIYYVGYMYGMWPGNPNIDISGSESFSFSTRYTDQEIGTLPSAGYLYEAMKKFL